jgi:hypothetical protein
LYLQINLIIFSFSFIFIGQIISAEESRQTNEQINPISNQTNEQTQENQVLQSNIEEPHIEEHTSEESSHMATDPNDIVFENDDIKLYVERGNFHTYMNVFQLVLILIPDKLSQKSYYRPQVTNKYNYST